MGIIEEDNIKHCDCLNTIRLLAALQVVYGHALTHLQLDAPNYFTQSIGVFSGVPIFFTLSGFLIWFSVGRSATFGDYCQKRFWRIYPELWVAVAVELAAVLVFYGHEMNWPLLGAFAVGQLTIFQFWTPDFLRGYGCGVPNGALWTICVLIQWYVVSFFTYKGLHGKGMVRWIVILMVALLMGGGGGVFQNDSIVFRLYKNSFVPYYWMFLAGSFVAEYKDKVLPMIRRWWWVSFVLTVGVMFLHCDIPALKYGMVRTITLFLACLGIGYTFPRLNIRTDISYGVYIYHMTIMNIVIVMGMKDWCGGLIAFAVTILLSWLSTKTIGMYCARKKIEGGSKGKTSLVE